MASLFVPKFVPKIFVLDYGQNDYRNHRLVEIAENLHRAELTALERDKLVEEWCELSGTLRCRA